MKSVKKAKGIALTVLFARPEIQSMYLFRIPSCKHWPRETFSLRFDLISLSFFWHANFPFHVFFKFTLFSNAQHLIQMLGGLTHSTSGRGRWIFGENFNKVSLMGFENRYKVGSPVFCASWVCVPNEMCKGPWKFSRLMRMRRKFNFSRRKKKGEGKVFFCLTLHATSTAAQTPENFRIIFPMKSFISWTWYFN